MVVAHQKIILPLHVRLATILYMVDLIIRALIGVFSTDASAFAITSLIICKFLKSQEVQKVSSGGKVFHPAFAPFFSLAPIL